MIVAALVVGAYAGYKLIPIYWQAHKVGNSLDSVRWEASKINLIERDSREEQLLERARNDIRELGVQDPYLDVYFGTDYRSVHADYAVDVSFLLLGNKRFYFKKQREIERRDL